MGRARTRMPMKTPTKVNGATISGTALELIRTWPLESDMRVRGSMEEGKGKESWCMEITTIKAISLETR